MVTTSFDDHPLITYIVFIDAISTAMLFNMPIFLNNKTNINLLYIEYNFIFEPFQDFVIVILCEIFPVDLRIYCMIYRLVKKEKKNRVLIDNSMAANGK